MRRTRQPREVDPSALNSTHLSPSFWWSHLQWETWGWGQHPWGIFSFECVVDEQRGQTQQQKLACVWASRVNRPLSPAGWIIFRRLNLLHVPQHHTRTSINCGLRSLARAPSLSGWDPTQPAEDFSDWWQLFQPRCHLLAPRKVILWWVNGLDVFVSVLNLLDESWLYLGDYWPLWRWSPFLIVVRMIFIRGRWLPTMQQPSND